MIDISALLRKVQKPARYTGGELNSVIKAPNPYSLTPNPYIRFAFCFPDFYEIGMSHLGMKILYGLINSRDDAWCERVFMPQGDMENLMRENGIPLFSIESKTPVSEFDIIGFTLQYELCYTNVLNMLDLAGVPLKSADRRGLTPLIIGGGPCVCNPEPVADFFDLFVLGEGEEVTLELIDLLKKHKINGSRREEFLAAAAKIDGIYVPSFYDVEYGEDNTIAAVKPLSNVPKTVKKRVIADLDGVYYPKSFVVPFVETVHDRAVAELFRGCTRGCRFCQAGFIYRPIREKTPETVNKQSRELCESTGYDEVSLCSLSSSDYPELNRLLNSMLEWADGEKVNIALPSLRADSLDEELAEKLNSVRKSGLTFAPEAGTRRLRDVINKNIKEDDILNTAKTAFRGGWNAVKLYFMLGLPSETEEDIKGMAELARKVVDEYYSNPDKPKSKGVSVNLSAATFVPKPFTPFQWEPQDAPDVIREKQRFLRENIRTRKVSAKFHNVETSVLEGVLARGDRRLAEVIRKAWENGAKADSWDDYFKFEIWESSFAECGVDMSFYANRRRGYDEILPWDHLDYGIDKAFLINESEKAKAAAVTPDCRRECAGCGADRLNGGKCNAGS